MLLHIKYNMIQNNKSVNNLVRSIRTNPAIRFEDIIFLYIAEFLVEDDLECLHLET